MASNVLGERPVYIAETPSTSTAAGNAAEAPAAAQLPKSELAFTDATTSDLAAVGLLVIGAGSALALGVRRRRRTQG